MKKIIIPIFTYLITAGLLSAEENLSSCMAVPECGDAEAVFSLARKYAKGEGVQQDYKKAFELAMKAAEQGHVEAQAIVSQCYRKGTGVERDYSKSFIWLKKAAMQGDAISQYNLAGMLYKRMIGEDVLSREEALMWLKEAAENGFADAQLALGELCYSGEWVAEDESEAKKWWEKAAAQGNAEAWLHLAGLYRADGKTKEALKHYRLAAEGGNVDAQYCLGYIYWGRMEGMENEENDEECRKWIQLAAERGSLDAKVVLGALYVEGKVLKQDIEKGKQLWVEAAEKGSEEAKENLRALEKAMGNESGHADELSFSADAFQVRGTRRTK